MLHHTKSARGPPADAWLLHSCFAPPPTPPRPMQHGRSPTAGQESSWLPRVTRLEGKSVPTEQVAFANFSREPNPSPVACNFTLASDGGFDHAPFNPTLSPVFSVECELLLTLRNGLYLLKSYKLALEIRMNIVLSFRVFYSCLYHITVRVKYLTAEIESTSPLL